MPPANSSSRAEAQYADANGAVALREKHHVVGRFKDNVWWLGEEGAKRGRVIVKEVDEDEFVATVTTYLKWKADDKKMFGVPELIYLGKPTTNLESTLPYGVVITDENHNEIEGFPRTILMEEVDHNTDLRKCFMRADGDVVLVLKHLHKCVLHMHNAYEVAHGDLHGANVLMRYYPPTLPDITIIDFGLSVLENEDDSHTQVRYHSQRLYEATWVRHYDGPMAFLYGYPMRVAPSKIDDVINEAVQLCDNLENWDPFRSIYEKMNATSKEHINYRNRVDKTKTLVDRKTGEIVLAFHDMYPEPNPAYANDSGNIYSARGMMYPYELFEKVAPKMKKAIDVFFEENLHPFVIAYANAYPKRFDVEAVRKMTPNDFLWGVLHTRATHRVTSAFPADVSKMMMTLR